METITTDHPRVTLVNTVKHTTNGDTIIRSGSTQLSKFERIPAAAGATIATHSAGVIEGVAE